MTELKLKEKVLQLNNLLDTLNKNNKLLVDKITIKTLQLESLTEENTSLKREILLLKRKIKSLTKENDNS